jgi:uncharacterized protein YkwD
MKILLALVIAASLVITSNVVFAETTGSDSQVVQSDIKDYKYTNDQLKALDHLNEIRVKAGLKKVKLNAFLTKAAENHANYVVVNKTQDQGAPEIHYETKGNPGFTGNAPTDRVKAVGGIQNNSEVIYPGQSTYTNAIDGWLDTAYHRTPLMDANASEFGISIVEGVAVGEMSNMKDTDNTDISVYPYNGMTDVGLDFYGSESPNPLEQFKIKSSGYIISFQPAFSVANVKATITNSRNEKAPFYYENDGGTLFLFPSYGLAADEEYKVSVDYTTKGVNQNKTWSFRTTKEIKDPARGYLINGIKINGKIIPQFEIPPMIRNDSVFVPLQGIFERLNAKVSWDDATKSITIKKQDTTVKLTIDSNTAYVNGKEMTLKQAPIFYLDSVFVPLRFISESIGAKFAWDNENQIANIDIELGEPEDPMIDLISRNLEKAKRVLEVAERYGYKYEIVYAGSGNSDIVYKLIDGNGDENAAAYTKNKSDNDYSSLALYDVSIPQTDTSKLLFFQEAIEAQTGIKIPGFANTLMDFVNAKEIKTVELKVGNIEISYELFKSNKTNGLSVYYRIKTATEEPPKNKPIPDPKPIPLPSGALDSSGNYLPRKPFTMDNVGVGINGHIVKVSPPARMLNGSTFIPLRGVFEAIGAKVEWFGDTRSIEVVKGNITVRLTINDKTAYVNGEPITLSTAPFVSSEGSTYVPLRFISETIGAKVGWDTENFVALIVTGD